MRQNRPRAAIITTHMRHESAPVPAAIIVSVICSVSARPTFRSHCNYDASCEPRANVPFSRYELDLGPQASDLRSQYHLRTDSARVEHGTCPARRSKVRGLRSKGPTPIVAEARSPKPEARSPKTLACSHNA